MPDGITITPEAPKVKAADVIASADHKVEATGGISTATESGRNLLASIDTKNKINELKAEKDGSLKDQVAKRKEVPDYTQEDFKKTSEALGVDTVLKADYEALAKYLEAIKKSSREGTPLTLPNGARENIGRILYMRGGVSDKLSDFEDAFQGNKVAMYRFIEDSFGRDVRFQKEVVNALTTIRDGAEELKNTDSEEKTTLTTEQETLATFQATLLDQIRTTLARHLEEDQIGQIKKLIEVGSPPDTIVESIKMNMGYSVALEKYEEFDSSYSLHAEEEKIAEDALQKAREALNNAAPNAKNRNALIANVSRYEGELAKARSRKTEAETSKNVRKSEYMAANGIPNDDPDKKFDKALQTFQTAKPLLENDGSLVRLLNTTARNQSRLSEIRSQIKQIDSNPENESSNKRRQELVGELEGAIDEAMAEFLSRRYEDAATDRDIELDEAKKKAEKDGKTWKAGALGDIKKLSSDIRKYDRKERKFVYNKDRMAGALRRLSEYSADGKDGSRQLFAETVGFKTDPEELKLDIVKQVWEDGATRDDATYEGLTAEKQLEADSLLAQRTADFESLYAEQGESFKKTLFESYFANKGFMDKIGHGKLSLTDDEVAILNKQFGSLMESELEKSGLMKTLKEKGIVPDSKLKILLALLAILGIGAVAAVGIAPAAIATAGAAKGIGSAAWSEGIV